MIKRTTGMPVLITIMVCLASVALLASCSKRPTGKKTWEEAEAQALEIIAARSEWPGSPEAVAKAFWDASASKNYSEMEILWPGSGSWEPNWAEICKNDHPVKYVFGEPSKDGSEVPYASEEYFIKNGSYNLTMRLSSIQTEKGRRFYIASGN
jgi:hypothetical protein